MDNIFDLQNFTAERAKELYPNECELLARYIQRGLSIYRVSDVVVNEYGVSAKSMYLMSFIKSLITPLPQETGSENEGEL